MIEPFQTTFAVPLNCESCIKDVSTSLYKIDGIQSVDASLSSQSISIRGTAAPSSIVSAIQSTGRDAILRGSGASNSAAVCILETHFPLSTTSPVRGLARLVQVSPTHTLIDLTIRGLTPGTYHASIRETGDISRGALSLGNVWSELFNPKEALTGNDRGKGIKKGFLGTLKVGLNGTGNVFLDKPVQIWEMIGRGMVVSRDTPGDEGRKNEGKDDADTVVGVIARSAGVWDNDKTVCSCSGKTVWEEREEMRGKGML